jgi:chemotaxis protein histidine kinase CheA
MTDGDLPTGENAQVNRDAASRAPQGESGADESRDGTAVALADDDAVPRCKLRRCRKVFPPEVLASTGRPKDFCPPKLTTWGPKKRTCAELGKYERLYVEVWGEQSLVGDIDVERLSTTIATLLGPVAGLHTQLTGVSGQLDTAVTTATADLERMRIEITQALAQATADARLRKIAEDQAAEAIKKQVAAERAAEKDRKDREQAVKDKLRAENEQARLEGENTQLKARTEQANEAAARDRTLAEETKTKNTELMTQVEQLTDRLALADERADAERERADKAVAAEKEFREQTTLRIDAIRAEANEQVEQARQAAEATKADAQQKIADAHAATAAAVERLGREYAENLQRLMSEHATALAERDRQLTAAQLAFRRTLRQAQHDVFRLLDDNTPDPTVPPTTTEERLRTDLAALVHGWDANDANIDG